MTDPRPPARRRRFVPDARLLLGVALVMASVAGVVALVNAADTRATVYVAVRTFTPGDRVLADDLLARRVALDDATGLYLSAGDIPDGLVATAVVRQGELVARSAVGSAAGTASTSIVLHLSGEVSESVVAGAVVDVWASSTASAVGELDADDADGSFSAPIVLCADAVVTRVVESQGIVGAADGQSVEVLVPRTRIARLLQAIADDDALAVVPAGIPLAGR